MEHMPLLVASQCSTEKDTVLFFRSGLSSSQKCNCKYWGTNLNLFLTYMASREKLYTKVESYLKRQYFVNNLFQSE